MDKVNALPDAGGGGGTFENCTVSFTSDGMTEVLMYPTVVDGALQTEYLHLRGLFGTQQTLSVLKGGSISAFTTDTTEYVISGTATVTRLADDSMLDFFGDIYVVYTIIVLGDTTISEG